MKKLTTILSSFAIAALAGLFFSSCTSETATTGSVSSNVVVTSATVSSITVSWTRDANDASADTIIVTTSNFAQAGNSPVAVTSGSTGTVNNLTTGVAYTIIIGSSSGRSSSITYTIAPPPTGLMVNSASATSIGAQWTRGAGDNGTDTIVAISTSGTVTTSPSNGSTGVINGLSEGTAYTISVHNATGSTTTMTWETAQRYTGIKIYEKSDPSSTNPSALVLASNAVAAIPLSGASNADFVLDDVASVTSGISLESGSVYNGSWNATRVNPSAVYVSGGLNNYYRSTDYTADIVAAIDNAYDLPNDAVYNTKGSAILICQNSIGNLALIEIVPDAGTGQLYSTSASGYKYITVNVSYQSQSAIPYAARGRARNAGFEPRISAH